MTLHIICGPMFSGKSSELIMRYKRQSAVRKRCLMVNHASDVRVSGNAAATHSGTRVNGIKASSILEVLKHLNTIEVDSIFIDEAQFFDDLHQVRQLAQYYEVHLAGLVSDYQQNPIGKLHMLMCAADNITFCRALCHMCGKPAPFTRRVVQGDQQILVGAVSEYRAVCRGHLTGDMILL